MKQLDEWRTWAKSEDYVVSLRAGVVLCRVLGVPSTTVLEDVRAAVQSCDAPAVVIIVVTQAARIPSNQTRLQAIRLMTDLADHIAAWVIVLEGAGFLRAAMRSVANTLRLLARPRFPMQVVTTAEEAIAWLSEKADVDVVAEDLHGSVAAVAGD